VDLHLSLQPDADALLSENPLALLIGMVLDQQIPLEWAFAGPATLQRRLGRPLDAADLAAMDVDDLVAAFAERPALHRYPKAMATRVHDLCALLVDRYGGRAEAVWADASSGAELIARLQGLPGFGAQKAKIFAALLGKQAGVRPSGWRRATSPFGDAGTFCSVADITGEASLAKVRAYKQDMKAAAREAKAAAAASAPTDSSRRRAPATRR